MKIMGILNVTPDSFSDGGKYINVENAIAQAKKMVQNGADIIDVGGESTRPGANPVNEKEELARIIPVIKQLSQRFQIPISIDTYKAQVAQLAIEAGATMINDVWAGQKDPDMLQVMANANVPVILMHNRSQEKENKNLHNIVDEVISELNDTIHLALKKGVKSEHIIIDPGIGFGKTLAQNIKLIQQIDQLKCLGYPVLLAASKKRTIRALAQTDEPQLLGIGTMGITCHAYLKNIDFIRVHDVLENKIAINVLKNLKSGGKTHDL